MHNIYIFFSKCLLLGRKCKWKFTSNFYINGESRTLGCTFLITDYPKYVITDRGRSDVTHVLIDDLFN